MEGSGKRGDGGDHQSCRALVLFLFLFIEVFPFLFLLLFLTSEQLHSEWERRARRNTWRCFAGRGS